MSEAYVWEKAVEMGSSCMMGSGMGGGWVSVMCVCDARGAVGVEVLMGWFAGVLGKLPRLELIAVVT